MRDKQTPSENPSRHTVHHHILLRGTRRLQMLTLVTLLKICLLSTPFKMRGLKKMIKMLEKCYSVPSLNFFSTVVLPALYSQSRTDKIELRDMHNFAATSDLWDDSVHHRRFHHEKSVHTDSVLPSGSQRWGSGMGTEGESHLLEKMMCIITDSGPNIVKAAAVKNWTSVFWPQTTSGYRWTLYYNSSHCKILSIYLNLTNVFYTLKTDHLGFYFAHFIYFILCLFK